jgi:deazaflavin-dependent oxidoreductase (nitroreductase family)
VKRSWLLIALGALVGAYIWYLRSEAYRNGNQLFYRDGRPNRAGRALAVAWSRLAGIGLTPDWFVSLETIGRRTGRVRAAPVILADHAGERYIVSMLGERAPWVGNIRAAGGRATLRHGRRREVHLAEVPPAERAPILRAYLGRAAGGRPHIQVAADAPVEAFGPVAAAYPVFRIEPAGGA